MSNKSNSETKPKRGTIGFEIAKLVKRYGSYSNGLYILESALEKATNTRGVRVVVGLNSNVLVSETPRHKELLENEARILREVLGERAAA